MYSLAHQYFVPKETEDCRDLTADRPGEIMLGKPFKSARVRVFNTKLEVVSLQTIHSSLYLVYQRPDAPSFESSTSLLRR